MNTFCDAFSVAFDFSQSNSNQCICHRAQRMGAAAESHLYYCSWSIHQPYSSQSANNHSISIRYSSLIPSIKSSFNLEGKLEFFAQQMQSSSFTKIALISVSRNPSMLSATPVEMPLCGKEAVILAFVLEGFSSQYVVWFANQHGFHWKGRCRFRKNRFAFVGE